MWRFHILSDFQMCASLAIYVVHSIKYIESGLIYVPEVVSKSLLFLLDSITRIRFAHNDSHLLAIASADGTASICHIAKSDPSTTTPVSHRIDYLQVPQPLPTTSTTKNLNRYHPPAAIMDVAWSVANDFVATVSLDSSLCLWNVNRRGTLARHLRDVATPGGGLMVCEFHPVNNNYLILGDTMGLVQVRNIVHRASNWNLMKILFVYRPIRMHLLLNLSFYR